MLKGFEHQLAARQRLDLYVLKKSESASIVADALAVISTGSGLAAAQAVGARITAWQQSLSDLNASDLNPVEAEDVRALRVDILEVRAQLEDYGRPLI